MKDTTSGKLTAIFESNFTGHRSMYISHLMRYINDSSSLHHKFIFILPKGMREMLGVLADSSKYTLEFVEFQRTKSNSVLRSFEEWKWLRDAIKKYPAINKIIFMEVDSYLILISSSRFKKLGLKVIGILFQPYIHFKEIKGGLDFQLRKIWKNFLFQKYALVRNKNIEQLFIINDTESINILNRRLKEIFNNIPDPIETHKQDLDESFVRHILKKYDIDDNQKNLLVFGSIDSRKNLKTIIDALLLLPEEIRKNIHLIISGKFASDIRTSYLDYIDKHKNELSVAYNDDFVGEAEREIIFQNCHLVLMPYINFYSASSVIGHAISYNKNIVAPNKGLLAKIVRLNKLGLNVNPHNAVEIKDAVLTLLSESTYFSYDGEKLIDEYNPANFSKILLSN
ncbi:MAG: glycosyltransferase [Ginsengibacter sp.]